MSELSDLVDKLVQEQTFSLAGMDAIKALRERVARQDKDLVDLNRQVDYSTKEQMRVEKELKAAQSTIDGYKLREKELAKREQAMTDLEKRVAVAEASLNATNATMAMFLKNTTVRQQVFSNRHIPVVPGPNGMYPVMQNESSNETVTTEHE